MAAVLPKAVLLTHSGNITFFNMFSIARLHMVKDAFGNGSLYFEVLCMLGESPSKELGNSLTIANVSGTVHILTPFSDGKPKHHSTFD